MKQIILTILFLTILLESDLFSLDFQELKKQIFTGRMKADRISKSLEENKEKIKEISNEENDIISELYRIEKRLYKKKKELEKIIEGFELIETKVENTQGEIEKLSQNIKGIEVAFRRRLVTFYKFGRPSYISAVFSANSFPDLCRKYKYMEILINYDSQLIANYQKSLIQIKAQQQKLKQEEKKWYLSKKEGERTKREIEKERLAKVKILKAVNNKKKVHQEAIKELENASLDLQNLLMSLEKEAVRKAGEKRSKPKVKGFVAQKGRLAIPVEGKITTLFGKMKHPKFHTLTFHNGIDIEAPFGSEIRSIFKGKVLYSGWFKGYGKILIINHGDHYYSLFAHLSQLHKEVGDKVKRGELIALVGETGSIKGSYLYFEIRHHGKTEDPLDWLEIFPEKEFSSTLLTR